MHWFPPTGGDGRDLVAVDDIATCHDIGFDEFILWGRRDRGAVHPGSSRGDLHRLTGRRQGLEK
jgi:hypothetical protein